jgi:hypothetical protein
MCDHRRRRRRRQSVFDSLEEVKAPVKGGTIVISGDGRCVNIL